MTERTPEEIVADVREDFDIVADAEARPKLTDSVTIYLDEPTGKALGGVEPKYRTIRGVQMPDGERRWGVVGRIADLAEKRGRRVAALGDVEPEAVNADPQVADFDAAIDELMSEAEALQEKLAASGRTFHLQALPQIILEDARGKALEHVGLTVGADVPADKEDAFQSRMAAEVLSRIVVGIEASNGAKGRLLDVDRAEKLPGVFPPSEYARLAKTIGKLQYETAIAEGAVDNADF